MKRKIILAVIIFLIDVVAAFLVSYSTNTLLRHCKEIPLTNGTNKSQCGWLWQQLDSNAGQLENDEKVTSSVIYNTNTPIFSPNEPKLFPQLVPQVPIGDYADVLVIINSESPISQEVGKYFAEARNIPEQNIAYVNVSDKEEIDEAEFEALRSQIENYIVSHNLQDKIYYLVTTKGIPIKVKRNNNSSASVESELALILGPYSDDIGKDGHIENPYQFQTDHFSQSKYGIYLVTRLDGYTFSDIKRLIDNAANPVPLSSSTKFIFDVDPGWNNKSPQLNTGMQDSANNLIQSGYNVLLGGEDNFITNQSDAIGYVSFGSNDHRAATSSEHAAPMNTWHPGAIAETFVSTSGRTFTAPASYGQSLVADLIAEGITGADSYVYEPYDDAMLDTRVLFDRYTTGYNLAESFYMAIPYLSWMDAVIGDPKVQLVAEH